MRPPNLPRRVLGLLSACALTATVAACSSGANEATEPTDQSVLGEETADGEGRESITAIYPWTLEETAVVVADRGGDEMVTGIRSGTEAGFDRIVVDMSGSGPVGWETTWSTNPVEEGRGERLEISGKEFLEVTILGTRIPETEQDYQDYFDDFEAHKVGDFEWIYDGTFEGRSHVVVGMDSKTEYRIFTLTDPLRLVIDLKTE